MSLLQPLLSRLEYYRLVEARIHPGRRIYAVTAVILTVNLLILVAYQRYLGVDYPFEDEWGYVDRLTTLHSGGFFHYLFDRYQTYFIPVFLFIWYIFYALTHLDLMAMRYAGAVVSMLVALLLCAMLYRKSPRMNPPTLVAILGSPFIICSLNHWATYNQAIESVAEPLLFGTVLASTWAAEQALQSRRPAIWLLLCVVGGLVASGIYAPGLSLLPAIVAARFILLRRIDWPLMLLGTAAVCLPIVYLLVGQGLGTDNAAHGFDLGDLPRALLIWVGLEGNSLFTPAAPSSRSLTLVLGTGVILIQVAGMVFALRRPAAQRSRFIVPVTLTLYTTLVFLEILITRFNEPDAAFTPRYSVHMLGGIVSVLFWVVTLPASAAWGRLVATAAVALAASGVLAADAQTSLRLGSMQTSFADSRRQLLALQDEPDAHQQQSLFMTAAMGALAYPGRLFLEDNALAMYSGEPRRKRATATVEGGLKITNFGPDSVVSDATLGTRQDRDVSLWIRVNRIIDGDAYIMIGDRQLQTAKNDYVLAAVIPKEIYAKPGRYPVFVVATTAGGTKSNVVNITVR